jgi:hypothetical protein
MTRIAAAWLLPGALCASSFAQASCRDFSVDTPATVVVDAQFAAFNAHDLEAFASCYTQDVSMLDLSNKQPPIRGQAALRRAFAYLPHARPGAGVQLVSRMVTGHLVIDQERPLIPGKAMPDVIAVYEVSGGRIQRVWFPPST